MEQKMDPVNGVGVGAKSGLPLLEIGPGKVLLLLVQVLVQVQV